MVNNFLRRRDGTSARVSFSELLFDLIYVFAVTQLSHYMLHHLTISGTLETLVMWFAIWLAWQYTAWVTNWFDPDARQIRLLLFFIMVSGLFMTAAIPDAFKDRGLVFALAYIAIQVGRTIVVLALLEKGDPLRKNFQRILGWLVISGFFWLIGGLGNDEIRLASWAIAVICEYIAPMLGFRLPILGKSISYQEWKIEGHHLAERCQLFVIVALGETILITGSSLSELNSWNMPVIISALVAFISSLAMWWIYFDTSSEIGSHVISEAKNPGLMGSYFHYIHAILVGSVIVCAVANELVIAHPDQHIKAMTATILLVGPTIYLLTNAIYKRLVYGHYPLSHLLGLLAFCFLLPTAFQTDSLMLSLLTTAILVTVGCTEGRSRSKLTY
jgi:low temperature requirement protein LtrA